MRTLTALALIPALLAAPSPSEARWQVKSEFRLHLPESLFDTLVEDFWQSLQGGQNIAAGNISFQAGPNTSVRIHGINVNINYSFPIPRRVSQEHREWELKSEFIAARVSADQLLATQVQITEKDGIIFENVITVECRNIALVLPRGAASVSARVRAEVAQNQVQLSMPSYGAEWGQGSWQVESLHCPQLANIQGQIREQIVSYLSSFNNLDADLKRTVTEKFAQWSKDSSLLLLSQLELPSKNDYMKIHYEPKEAKENGALKGLQLSGTLRFDYPFIAPGENHSQEFALPAEAAVSAPATPQLLIPFATIRALMMGEYFAGKLEYGMRSTELPAFQSLMQSRWQQFFGWPDLMTYDTQTTFLFQFLPLGPPHFTNEKSGGAGVITGDLTLPLSARMFAPLQGKWTPYVEFRSLLAGPASLTLQKGGKIQLKISAAKKPATYAFAEKYLKSFAPNSYIAIDTMAAASRDSLGGEGIQLSIPSLLVGKQIELAPQSWSLESGQTLRLDFTAARSAKP